MTVHNGNNALDWVIRTEAPKGAIYASLWRTSRDCMVVDLRGISTPHDGLRYSPIFLGNLEANRR
jgi:hypothetical protein